MTFMTDSSVENNNYLIKVVCILYLIILLVDVRLVGCVNFIISECLCFRGRGVKY